VVSANFLIDAESNLNAAFSGFGQGGEAAKADAQGEAKPGAPAAAAAPATYRGEGVVKAVDAAHASVTLAHEPIASLKWPAMTMDFKVKDAALLRALKPGQRVVFDLAGESGGEYTIVGIQAATAQPSTTSTPSAADKPAADAHQGH
jgi:membrane fusion protein, copper/silver efflux system